jgi:hypothetical protein
MKTIQTLNSSFLFIKNPMSKILIVMKKFSLKVGLLLILLFVFSVTGFAQCPENAGTGPTQDMDCDGVINSVDLDDDNDGILDVQEGCQPVTSWTKGGSYGDSVRFTGNSISHDDGRMPEGRAYLNSVYSSNFSTLGVTGDFIFSFTTDQRISGYFFMGVNQSGNNSGDTYEHIDYGFGLYGGYGNEFSIVENGNNKGLFGLQRAGDVFSIQKAGSIITYSRNGMVLYTSLTASTPIDYYIDTAFYNSGRGINTISNITVCGEIANDFDEDLIADRFDLDSDNDGIPDNIEAQTTAGYTAPNPDSAADYETNNGVNSAYLGGLFPVNTDGIVATPDFIDLDADNDGLFDIVESGSGLLDANTDGKTDGTVGVNGLDNTLEAADDYTDVNGSFDATQTDNFTDTDGDANGGGDVDYRDTSTSIDTDSDGVFNETDRDDDNDGLLDVTEGASNTDNDSIINALDLDSDNDGIPDNIEAQTTAGYRAPNADSAANYRTNNGVNSAYLAGLAPVNTDKTDTPDYIDLDADNDGLFDIVESGSGLTNVNTDGETDGSVGANGLDNTLEIADDYTDVNGSFDATQTDNFTDTDGDLNSGGNVDYRDNEIDTDLDGVDDFVDLDDDNDGLLDTQEGLSDTDYDGIINALDLDSDNDGIPDNIEAQTTVGYIAPNADSAIDYVTNNGVNSAYLLGLTPINTDVTDALDYVNHDSDNDGIFDIVESGSGLIDVNTDGRTDGTVGANGLDNTLETADDYTDVNGSFDATQTDNFTDIDGDVNTGGDVDYRDVVDSDKDGVLNDVDLDDDNDGILDTQEGLSDTDNDGIINALDLDSDNDGIPDNIEAQTTVGYIAPNADSVADYITNNGVNSAYLAGLTLVNTACKYSYPFEGIYIDRNVKCEAADTPDYINLDADNDGIFDILEAGSGLTDANADGKTDGAVGTNGLDNTLEAADDYTDVNGSFDVTQTNNFTDTDGDANGGGDLDYRDITTASIDTDDDGVFNETDLDDDNDGLLDTQESCQPIISWTKDTRGTGNTVSFSDDSFSVNGQNSSFTESIYSSNFSTLGITSDFLFSFTIDQVSEKVIMMGVNQSGVNGNASFQYTDYAFIVTATNYFMVFENGAQKIGIQQPIAAGAVFSIQKIGTVITYLHNGNVFYTSATPAIHSDYYIDSSFSTDFGTPYTISNIKVCGPLDFDNDTIINTLDLDADNDGIPDNIEAQTTVGYKAPNADNTALFLTNNGVNSAYLGGLTPVNTEGAYTSDYLDTDSDNDGVFDIVESGSGLTDANADGKTDGAVGANGLDNGLETADDYTDVNGSFDTTQTDNFTNTDGNIGEDVDYRAVRQQNRFTGNGNWSEVEKWTGGIPLPNSNITIAAGVSCTLQIDNLIIYNFTLETGATLVVPKDKEITVNGHFATDNGSLVLESDTNDSGVLLIKGTTSGTITYKRGGLLANAWSLVTPPVSGQKILSFAQNTDNDIRTNTTVSPTRYAIGYYDDSQAVGNKWRYYTASTPVNDEFIAGESYSMSRNTDGEVSFTGSLNVNTISKTLTPNKWFAIGNPYTTYLAVNKNSSSSFLNDNFSKLDDTFKGIYMWDNIQNKYIAVTEVNTLNRYLTPGQGFFVRLKNGESTISFNEDKRQLKPASGTSVFAKNSTTKPEIILKISDSDATVNTYVKYFDTATNGFDAGYDIGNFNGASLDVFTHLLEDGNDINYTIQSLPSDTFEGAVIPIGVRANSGTEIIFSAETISLPKEIKVYIEDKVAQKTILLEEFTNYKVVLNEDINNTVGRFYLHTTSSVLGLEKDAFLNSVSMYLKNNIVLKIVGLEADKAKIIIHTLLGKQVFSTTFKSNGVSEIALPKLASGVYLVQLQTAKGILTKKIILE